MDKQVTKLNNKRNKKTEEKEEKPQKISKKIRNWALILLCLGLFTLVFLSHTSYFEIDNVIITGNQRIEANKVLDKTGLKGKNILLVDRNSISEEISANKWVKDVDVTTSLPNEVTIELEERKPTAVTPHEDNSRLVISSDLIILDKILEDNNDNIGEDYGYDDNQLPLIRGLEPNSSTEGYDAGDKLNFNEVDPEKEEKISNVLYLGEKYVPDRTLELIFHNGNKIELLTDFGLKVRLGKLEKLEEKYSVLAAILPELEGEEKNKEYEHLDLRVPEYPTLKEIDENNGNKEKDN